MTIDDALLARVAADVCNTMLGLGLENSEHTSQVSVVSDGLTASVQITGEWSGLLETEACDKMAQSIASQIFELEKEELTDDDIRDALGEVANMVGGNLKGMIPGDTLLSIPRVERGMPQTGLAPSAALTLVRDDSTLVLRYFSELPVAACE